MSRVVRQIRAIVRAYGHEAAWVELQAWMLIGSLFYLIAVGVSVIGRAG